MSQFKIGDVVYGHAHFHKEWVYVVVDSVFESESKLFGTSIDSKNGGFYMMYFDKIVPQELLESPLWKALE